MKDEAQISVRAVSVVKDKKRFSDARFSADGLSIITTCDSDIKFWNAETGQPLGIQPDLERADSPNAVTNEYNIGELKENIPNAIQEDFPSWADLVSISPNGAYIAVGSKSGYLHVLDLTRGMTLILNGHSTSFNNHMYQNSIISLLFDASSSYLISMADEDEAPLLWDLSATGEAWTWNKKPALRLTPTVKLNEVTPAGIDTIQFSPTAPRFVTTHRKTETAAVWEILR